MAPLCSAPSPPPLAAAGAPPRGPGAVAPAPPPGAAAGAPAAGRAAGPAPARARAPPEAEELPGARGPTARRAWAAPRLATPEALPPSAVRVSRPFPARAAEARRSRWPPVAPWFAVQRPRSAALLDLHAPRAAFPW